MDPESTAGAASAQRRGTEGGVAVDHIDPADNALLEALAREELHALAQLPRPEDCPLLEALAHGEVLEFDLARAEAALAAEAATLAALRRRAREGPTPRGLSRKDAAAYLGIGTTLFDRKVKAGDLPAPTPFGRRKVWNRAQLDVALEGGAGASGASGGASGSAPNPWDSLLETAP